MGIYFKATEIKSFDGCTTKPFFGEEPTVAAAAALVNATGKRAAEILGDPSFRVLNTLSRKYAGRALFATLGGKYFRLDAVKVKEPKAAPKADTPPAKSPAATKAPAPAKSPLKEKAADTSAAEAIDKTSKAVAAFIAARKRKREASLGLSKPKPEKSLSLPGARPLGAKAALRTVDLPADANGKYTLHAIAVDLRGTDEYRRATEEANTRCVVQNLIRARRREREKSIGLGG